MMARRISTAIVLALAGGVFMSTASAEWDKPLSGKATAQMVCARCHEVGTAQIAGRSIGDGTPPAFVMIARDPKMTPDALRRYIRFPHGAMDAVFITQRETDALVAYIQGLRTAEKAP